MPEYLAPGVYVEETSFRSKSIEGVSTTTTGFIGPTRYGPHTRISDIVTSLAEFERVYGDGEPLKFTDSAEPIPNYMWHAVRAFFQNGGKRLYIARVLADSARKATGPVVDVAPKLAFTADGTRNEWKDIDLAHKAIIPGSVRVEGKALLKVTGEDPQNGQGDGSKTVFDMKLAHPVAEGTTLEITWDGTTTAKKASIDKDGVTTGDADATKMKLDRATGTLHVELTVAPAAGKSIKANYEWIEARVARDNTAGELHEGGGAKVGTIDHATGMLSVTFTAAPPAGAWMFNARKVENAVTARFAGAAGDGTLKFAPRVGQNLVKAGALTLVNGKDPVQPGDFVQVVQTGKTAEWRTVTKIADQLEFTTGGDSRDVSQFSRISRLMSVSISFTRAGQKSPAGVWDNIKPTEKDIMALFSEQPKSDDLARTLPVIITAIQPGVIQGGEIVLTGGADGDQPQNYGGSVNPANDERTGLTLFEDAEDISIVAAPGLAGLTAVEHVAAGVSDLHAHVHKMRYRVAIVDSIKGQSIAEVRQFRGRFDSTHMALYYPWVRILDPISGAELDLPPSGFIAGIYARNDVERAVYKAPANEVINLALGFERTINQEQQAVVNPEGINCLRFFEGRGLRVWGARTMSSDSEWKYINVRRYFAYLERSIDRGTQWAVFEPNGPLLWGNVRRTIEDFLLDEYQSGALLGSKPENAFFIRCDRSTMTQNDIDNGRLMCLIGVAPLKPAEFVIFRIGQWTADAKS